MLTLLSPAKKLDYDKAQTPLDATQPVMLDDSQDLAVTAKQQSADDLKRLMKISDTLAELNAQRFQAFTMGAKSNSAKPAALVFNGDVYGGLDAGSFSQDSLSYAQDHLRILSGLYGLLRPLDAIQPYRLEMGTRLANSRGKNLYEFWGDRIANLLNEDSESHSDATIVNLASHEYFKSVDKTALKRPVIEAAFMNVKDGEARALMFYAKRARGLMARWIMDNRIDQASGLKDFNLEGYIFDSAGSTENRLVFSRPQPATKS